MCMFVFLYVLPVIHTQEFLHYPIGVCIVCEHVCVCMNSSVITCENAGGHCAQARVYFCVHE